jgi:hypothetical protein
MAGFPAGLISPAFSICDLRHMAQVLDPARFFSPETFGSGI